jgi:hypothetical protein
MALVKRGRTWHTHFFVDGVRYRQSLGTRDWREAQAKEKELITQAAQGNLAASVKGFAKLPFLQAAEQYFSGRKVELGESSQKKERQLLVKPCEFFQQKSLTKITTEDVLRFREWRSEDGAGPATINMEVGIIRRMLKTNKTLASPRRGHPAAEGATLYWKGAHLRRKTKASAYRWRE